MTFWPWDYSEQFATLAAQGQKVLAAVANLTKEMTKMTAASERLTREVQETRAAVADLATRVQAVVDELKANAEDTAAVNAAADELDAIQTELSTIGSTPTQPAPEEPAEEE